MPKYVGKQNVIFLSIPEVGEKQCVQKRERVREKRKSVLTMVSTYAWTKSEVFIDSTPSQVLMSMLVTKCENHISYTEHVCIVKELDKR